MTKISRITGVVKQLTILAGWACILITFVGFFLGVTGVLGYVAFKMDEINARQISMAEAQHLDTLTISKYLNDLKMEVRARKKESR